MACGAKIGDLGGFMELGTYAVTHKVPHHRAAVLLYILLHSMRDVEHPVSGAGQPDALPKALLGDLDETQGLIADLPAGEGGRAVAMETVQAGAYVHTDDVALLQLPVVRDAVDDHVVDGNAGRAGKPVVIEERRPGAVSLDELSHGGVDLQGGYAGAHHGAGQGPGLGGQPPGPAHPLDLARGFQGDHFHPHASNAFMTSTLVSSMVGWFSTGLRMPRWA